MCLLHNPSGLSEVGVISLSSPDQRLFVPPLAGLEEQGHRSLGGGGAAGRLSYSLHVGFPSVLGAHPHAFVFHDVHQGESSGGGDPFSCTEGCGGASSSAFSGILQPVICGVEDLRVVEARDRPLSFEPLHQQDPIQNGDACVGSCFSSTGRLDGLPQSGRGLLAGSGLSGQPQVLEVCGLKQSLSVSGSLLWPLDCTTGLHQGYGSCFVHSSWSGYSSSSLPGRLASSGFLSGSGPQLSGDCPLPLSRARYSCESGEVEFCFVSAGSLSRDSHRLCVFQGFTFPETSREASLNRRRIPVLQAPARFLLAGSPQDSLLSLSLSHPVSGGRLCMWSLQLTLHRS